MVEVEQGGGVEGKREDRAGFDEKREELVVKVGVVVLVAVLVVVVVVMAGMGIGEGGAGAGVMVGLVVGELDKRVGEEEENWGEGRGSLVDGGGGEAGRVDGGGGEEG